MVSLQDNKIHGNGHISPGESLGQAAKWGFLALCKKEIKKNP